MKTKKTDVLIGNILVYTVVCNLLGAACGFGKYISTTNTSDADSKVDTVQAHSSGATMVRYDPALPRLPRDTCALRELLRDEKIQKPPKSKNLSDLAQILGRSQKQR